MRVAALLAIRNEQLYLDRCIRHYQENEVDVYVIDNGSNDLSRDIAESHLGKGVKKIYDLPYEGFYDWVKILGFKEAVAREIEADWFLHCDADEIRVSSENAEKLKDAFRRVDASGFNAVNFDEFVFLPTSDFEYHEGTDFVEGMKYYYYFSKGVLHRVNAWKNLGQKIDLVTSGGHSVDFAGRKVFPENFLMRHYIALSREHVIRKYKKERIYSQEEVNIRGWHKIRASFSPQLLRFPGVNEMKCVDDGFPDRSDPRSRHDFFGDPS